MAAPLLVPIAQLTDETGLRQLTNDAAHDRRPLWSADGARLMFYSSGG